MRKLALLLAFLMVFSVFAFADEHAGVTMEEAEAAIADLEALKAQVGGTNLVPVFSGNASVTFGVDLNAPVRMGFQNSATTDLTLTLFDTDASTGEGDVVGYIKLDDLNIAFDDDNGTTIDVPTATAKLILSPIEIMIYSAPSFSVGNAEGFIFDPTSTDDALNTVKPALSTKNTSGAATSTSSVVIIADTAFNATTDVLVDDLGTSTDRVVVRTTTSTPAAVFQGVTVTAGLDPITVNFMLASAGTWANPATASNYNDFAFGLTLSGSADPLNFNAGALFGPTDALDIGFTVGVDGSFDPISLDVGFDGFVTGGTFTFDASVGIGLALGVADINLLSYLDGATTNLDFNQGITVDLSGLAEPLTFTTSFDLKDILFGTLDWESDTSVSYDIDGIKPFATVGLHSVDNAALTFALTGGVELSGLIDNTVFTLQYASTNLSSDSGKITFATKITY